VFGTNLMLIISYLEKPLSKFSLKNEGLIQ